MNEFHFVTNKTVSMYPNPVTAHTPVKVKLDGYEPKDIAGLKMYVYNTQGALLKLLDIDSAVIEINFNLPSGEYICKLINDDQELKTMSFIVK